MVRDSVIPMQGAWVRSLVGTKIPHVGWSKKEALLYRMNKKQGSTV